MTFMIKPDDLSELNISRHDNEICLDISTENQSWVLVIPNGEILCFIAEALMHHHLDRYAESLDPQF